MLPRWFRIVLIVDAALVVAVLVLGARLALDGAHDAGRVITWARPDIHVTPVAGPRGGPAPPLALPPSAPPGVPGHPPLGPALLHRLDSDTAARANAQRGLLGLLEEAIRLRVVEILERAEHHRGGG
jgi:hypothetical protein